MEDYSNYTMEQLQQMSEDCRTIGQCSEAQRNALAPLAYCASHYFDSGARREKIVSYLNENGYIYSSIRVQNMSQLEFDSLFAYPVA